MIAFDGGTLGIGEVNLPDYSDRLRATPNQTFNISTTGGDAEEDGRQDADPDRSGNVRWNHHRDRGQAGRGGQTHGGVRRDQRRRRRDLDLAGGTYNINGTFSVGNVNGTGSVLQTAGSHTLSGTQLIVGNGGANGIYNLTDGTLKPAAASTSYLYGFNKAFLTANGAKL
ncbi:MAG TPA: hypothetical protein VGB55_13275, partial [Tepidisphaeraceae bacterium]